MKKKFFIPALILTGCIFFAACGRSSKSASEVFYDNGGRYYAEANSDSMAMEMPAVAASRNYSKSSEAKSTQSSSDKGNNAGNTEGIIQRKVIKTASLEVQTREFDSFIESLNAKIEEFGGYLENANVTGNNIYGTSSRVAYFTIRVPEDKLQPMMDSVGTFGTVTNSSYNEEDITLGYADVESRIKTLTTEQETLLGLLEKAAYLEDIIRLEERLSQVNYELETYKSRQRTYDNKISYSTLNVNVREVMKIANVVEAEPKTLGERIAQGFKDNMLNIRESVEAFIVWFISYIVNIVLFVAIVTGLTLIVIRYCKKHPAILKKTNKQDDETDETKLGNNK